VRAATEENIMITTEMPPTEGTPQGVHGQARYRRAVIIAPAILLTAVFISTGAPAATAAAVFISNNATVAGEPPPCRGDKPGICPYYYFDQQNKQNTTLADEQSVTLESSAS
jgi:hypothetical protein